MHRFSPLLCLVLLFGCANEPTIVGTDGLTITAPPGALPDGVELGVQEVDVLPAVLPDGVELISGIYELTPHGVQFNAPVTIEIDFDAAQVDGDLGDLGVYSFDDLQPVDYIWESVSGGDFDALGTATVDVEHFSFFIVGLGEPDFGDDDDTAPDDDDASDDDDATPDDDDSVADDDDSVADDDDSVADDDDFTFDDDDDDDSAPADDDDATADDDDATADDDDSASNFCDPVFLDCVSSSDSNATDGPDSQDEWDNYGCNEFSYIGSETVYEFTPANDGVYSLFLLGMTNDADIIVTEPCDPDTCIASSTSGSSSEDNLDVTLTGGSTYYIIVDGWAGAQTDYELFLDCEAACSLATNFIDCVSNTDSSDTAGGDAVDLWDDYGCNGLNYSGGEVVYSFFPEADGSHTIATSNMTDDLDIAVLSANCDNDDCLDMATSGSSSTESLTIDLEVGQQYFIVVDGWAGGHSAFDLTVTCAP